MSVKTLKSIDISSITIMTTAINIIFSIIASIVILIYVGIISANVVLPFLLLVPAIISATIIVSVYKTFIEGFLYNLISKKTSISFLLEDGTITKISTTSTALIVAIITTVILILEILIGMIILPIFLSVGIQSFMLAGQAQIASLLYQIYMLITNPSVMVGLIIGGFIVTFIYILIATYIYNFIASNERGVEVEIKDNNTLEKIDVQSFATAIALISLILGLITGILSAVSTGQYLSLISNTVMDFILGFIASVIIAVLYNKLSPKIGKIKFELIDE